MVVADFDPLDLGWIGALGVGDEAQGGIAANGGDAVGRVDGARIDLQPYAPPEAPVEHMDRRDFGPQRAGLRKARGSPCRGKWKRFDAIDEEPGATAIVAAQTAGGHRH